MVDYSKWDAIELSDDSDIEVHPNVDKRSFIRAKQSQIHQDRARRKHQITTLKYERIINDGLLTRIDNLLTALKSHKVDTASNSDELVLQSLMESAGDSKDDKPPPPPEGVHQNAEQPAYSRMMAALVDQVKQEVDKSESSEDRLEAFITGVTGHKDKVTSLQKELLTKLAELEKEEKKHITSDGLHDGFSHSHVNRKADEPKAIDSTSKVELLNPKASSNTGGDISSGAEADIEEGSIEDPEAEVSPMARKFAQIKFGNYPQSLQFIQSYPSILAEKEQDGLLLEAFNAVFDGKDEYGRQCVHQAILVQYCRLLGKDGVALFFKRITTQGHKAQHLFLEDVNQKFADIQASTARIKKQQDDAGEAGGVEQIQLHAVDPNTTINITVPPPIPTDLTAPSADPPPSEEQIEGRKIFESFPPNLQRALEEGSLEAVNVVLGKMSVDEAEEVVAKLSEGGILSVEEGVIDTTTEEGQQKLDEIHKTGQVPDDQEILSQDPPIS